MAAADIEQVLQVIHMHPPLVVAGRTVLEEVKTGDLPPLDEEAANVFSQSKHIM
jgi:hypothetical protein